MNFNLSKKPEYNLQARLTDELISLYGVQVKLLITEKINQDNIVFGDWSHLKTDSDKVHEIMGLPENSESWDDIGINFTEYGLINSENIRLFFSRKTIDSIFDDFDEGKGFKSTIGNLIVLPNNKIMEITDIEFEVPGINNLFTNADQKNVYKFTLVSYNNTLIKEISTDTISAQDENYTQLDDYFSELIDSKEIVDNESSVAVDENTEKPVLSEIDTVDSVFGRF